MVDSAIYEAVLAVMECLVTEYDIGGYVRERTGSILPMIAPSNVYPTRDGKMVLIGANQDSVFGRLAEAMGEPELADRRPLRLPHRARQQPGRARRTHRRLDRHRWTAPTLIERLNAHGIPNGDIYRAPEMLADAHFKAREAIVSVADPVFGPMRMQNVAPRLSETPGAVLRAPAPASASTTPRSWAACSASTRTERARLAGFRDRVGRHFSPCSRSCVAAGASPGQATLSAVDSFLLQFVVSGDPRNAG